MKPCARCRRHVRRSESDCPFCGAALPDALAPSPAAWSLGLAVFTAACGPAKPTGDGGSDGDTSGQPASSESGDASTTPEPTTTAPADTSSEGSSSSSPSSSSGCGFGCNESSEGGGAFYGGPDFFSHGPMCDPFTQDCADGEKCNPWADDGGSSWNDDKCVPVTGDGVEGDPCFAEAGGTAGLDDCAAGFFCWDVDPDSNGVCVQLCTGSPDMGMCESPDKTCAVFNDGTLPICIDKCDPLAQDCPAGDECVANPTGEGFLCLLDASGDEGQQHDACMYANACDPGLQCTDPTAANECDPNAAGCCEPFCDLTDPDADANCGGAGQVCTPFFEEGTAPPGLENIGSCSLP